MARVLRLTNSDDVNPLIPPGQRSPAVVERVFQRETGEALETEARTIWPTDRLPALVDRWVAQSHPDLVLLRMSAYWVTYASVPVRLQRRLGVLGRHLAGAGFRSADVPWLAGSRPYRWTRAWLARTVGAEPHFTVEQVLPIIEATARRVLADEHAVLVIAGPRNAMTSDISARGRALAAERRLAFHRGLGDLSRRLHIDYVGRETVLSGDADGHFLVDGVHASPSLHELVGIEEGKALAAAWLRTRAPGRTDHPHGVRTV